MKRHQMPEAEAKAITDEERRKHKAYWSNWHNQSAAPISTQEAHMPLTSTTLKEQLGTKTTAEIVSSLMEEKPNEKLPNLNQVDLKTQPKEGQVLNVTMDAGYDKVGALFNSLKVKGSTEIKGIKLEDGAVKIHITSMKKPEEVDVLIKKHDAKNITYTWGSK